MTKQTDKSQSPAVNNNSSSIIAVLLIVCGLLAGGIAGYFIGYDHGWERKDKKTSHSKNHDGKSHHEKQKESCQALTVTSPEQDTTITSPVTVTAIVNNTNPNCHWTVFEAQAGTMELKNANGQTIGTGVLTTIEEWMTDQPVTYTGIISFDPMQTTPDLTLTINEEKPNGEPGKQITHPLMY